MREEKVFFRNTGGQKICGLLALPDSQEPCPAVVGVHGFRSCKEGTKLSELAKRLTVRGIALLRIDLTDIGESEPRFEDTTLGRDADTLHAALQFLETVGGIDKYRLGVYGSSMGGIVAIIEAARNE
jgi:dienelactone hydrolase